MIIIELTNDESCQSDGKPPAPPSHDWSSTATLCCHRHRRPNVIIEIVKKQTLRVYDKHSNFDNSKNRRTGSVPVSRI